MKAVDIAVIAVIALILGLVVFFIRRQKKKGIHCIGCPDSGTCGGNCVGCSGHCGGCGH